MINTGGYNYKNGDMVNFKIQFNDMLKSKMGKVIGVGTIPQANYGTGYIVLSTDGDFPNKDYPYEALIVYESMMEKIEVTL